MNEEIKRIVIENPGIKAKTLASKIQLTKLEINQKLHDDDSYIQDKDTYGWSWAGSPQSVVIKLPSKWITSDVFEKTLISSGYIGIDDSDITIVFSEKSKLMMDAIARLISLVNQVAQKKQKVILDLSLASESKSYLNRAGFFEVLHSDVCILPKKPKNSKAEKYKGNAQSLVEFRMLHPHARDDGTPQLLFDSLSQALGEEYRAVYSFIAEIYNNVYDHVFDLKNNSLHGFAACQTYKRKNNEIHTQIVISDCGDGICNTLRPALKTNPALEKYRYLEDIELVVEAFTAGKITRLDPEAEPDHGMGLYVGANKAKVMDATILIRQESFSLKLAWTGDELVTKSLKKALKPIPGTNICFDFCVELSKITCLN